MTTNTDLADALREIANTLPIGSALVVRLAADRLGVDADGWIEWDPTSDRECPVADGTQTEVKFLDGNIHKDDTPQYWSWDDTNEGSNIIAYRVVKYRKWGP